MDSGLLEALKTPSVRETLEKKLDVKRPEMLEALLNIGIALGEISCRNGVYNIRGKRSAALAGEKGDPLAALVQANLTYYNSFYLDFNKRLHGAAPDNRLGEIGEVVARCSKLYEPFLEGFVGDAVAGKGAMRILDIGCGSGVYLRSAYRANPNVSGIGIDMDAAVVQQAQRNLVDWGIAGKFDIIAGDIRTPPAAISGTFDLIMLFNLIYYIENEERSVLLRSLCSMLSTGGTLAIANNVRDGGKDISSAHLNLATSSMQGCTPLPLLEEMTSLLKGCGFEKVKVSRLIPGISFYGIVSTS